MTVTELDRELRIIELAVEALRAKVNKLLIEQEKAAHTGRPIKFTDLEGIWAGADFSYEDIKAAEYTVPEDQL